MAQQLAAELRPLRFLEIPQLQQQSESGSSSQSFFVEVPSTFHVPHAEKLPALPLGRRKKCRKAVRSQSAIEFAILDACRTPTVQHWVMVKARLGYDTFWKHMNKLLSMGVMDETTEGSKTLYRINARGLEMLGKLSQRE
jgi:predicted transcriptional regulator